ncbi:MAG: hypothetical protein U0556_17820 [Dehalococcoidia bacterium]
MPQIHEAIGIVRGVSNRWTIAPARPGLLALESVVGRLTIDATSLRATLARR